MKIPTKKKEKEEKINTIAGVVKEGIDLVNYLVFSGD